MHLDSRPGKQDGEVAHALCVTHAGASTIETDCPVLPIATERTRPGCCASRVTYDRSRFGLLGHETEQGSHADPLSRLARNNPKLARILCVARAITPLEEVGQVQLGVRNP